MPKLTKGNAEYCKTKVVRQILNPARYKERGAPQWLTVAEYNDALVRDQGESGELRAPQVMLRAYTNDPNEFWDEEYQNGNGIYVQTKKEAAEFARYYEDPKVQQYVMDCDGDIALLRISGYLLNRHNFGSGHELLTVLVSYEAEKKEWNGWGSDQRLRPEQWSVSLKD